ncbi:YmfQ family protein [Kingella kingae]|uniref:YmfQ family protein n=1 Tax=Kingella kingae TaxID=504 RepID=UPI002550EC74|nr:YmfQ family protein [Kingella kingae]MDK4624164.1 YmfQ family protein [Kingella kingae]MDK4650115.1 YmfQ family protein [Kingella kingae]MDK4659743.1 YmfQ family protein [Kingella kingae]MDK4667735.1 YmfQ family protein [Kingella kingae]MDK4686097.1 YmfQ family protein [Kingella kingae]
MSYQEILIGLLPPVAYARNGAKQQQQAQIDAHVLDDVQSSAARVLNAMQPETSGEMLMDWERVLDLSGQGKSYSQRLSAVLLKINAIGGLSIPYFTQLAKSAGYTITIDEPQPFRVGINRAGDRLAEEDIMFVWVVNVQSNSQMVWRFRAGASAAGERLSHFSDSMIERIFQDLKPAHTAVRFTYQEQ